MRRLQHIILVIYVLAGFTAHAQDPQNMKVENQNLDCNKMKTSFSDIEEANSVLSATTFAFTQELKTTKRSGVKHASYFSCDNEMGYLLIGVDNKEYVYKNFPRFQWKLLVETNDLDDFYDESVRGKYLLVISSAN